MDTFVFTVLFILLYPLAANAQAKLLFKSGFEDSVSVSDMDMRGSDGMDWEADLEAYDAVQGFWLYNRGDDSFAEIRKDPTGVDNRCLYLQVDRGNRMQCELNFKRDADFQQVYARYRIFWPENLGRLSAYPDRIRWFTFFEIWEHHNDAEGGDQAGKTRWTFSFLKEEGEGSPLFWGVHAQGAQPDWHNLWGEENRDVPIPFGKWCQVDILFKRGKGEAGHIWLAVTPEGEEQQVVFDLYKDTEHPINTMPLRSFQLWKLSTHERLVEWMKENHQPISAYYDDFEWWSGKPDRKE